MTVSITYDELKALNPCRERFAWARENIGDEKSWNGRKIDAATARKMGATFDDLVWVASELAIRDKDVKRKLRLWSADCAARVLHIYEKTETSKAPREAIVAARQYARGEINSAAWAAAWAPAGTAAWAAARAAARATARDAAWGAEEDWQFDRLILWLSDDEPEDWPLDREEDQ